MSSPILKMDSYDPYSLIVDKSDSNFATKMKYLRSEKERNVSNDKKPIVIIGAGPAGLMSAITSLVEGNKVVVIEKYGKDKEGRQNIVDLKKESIYALRYYGVLHYLVENKLIENTDYWTENFNKKLNMNDSIQVRICDLEKAMKAVLHQLDPKDETIIYSSEIAKVLHPQEDENISKENENISIEIKTTSKDQSTTKTIEKVGVLVLTSGAHTAESLKGSGLEGIKKAEHTKHLKEMSVISANLKPSKNSSKLERLTSTALAIYYHVVGVFVILNKIQYGVERGTWKIHACIRLRVPGQHSVGVALSEADTKKMEELKSKVDELTQANTQHPTKKGELKLKRAKAALDAYLKDKAHIAAAVDGIIEFIGDYRSVGLRKAVASVQPWYNRVNARVIKTTSSEAQQPAWTVGSTLCMLRGDSLVVADPASGLGATTAIKTTNQFLDAIKDVNNQESLKTIVHSYNSNVGPDVRKVVSTSISRRSFIRPKDVLKP